MSRPLDVLVKPHHLAARLVWTLTARRPPDVVDEVWAEQHLLPGEIALWRRMSNEDRRHSTKVARRFLATRPESTRAEIAGALLHDVGKIECGLGTWGRVVATIVGGRTERFRAYHDHEHLGSLLAADAGSEPATVELIDERGPLAATLKACDRT